MCGIQRSGERAEDSHFDRIFSDKYTQPIRSPFEGDRNPFQQDQVNVVAFVASSNHIMTSGSGTEAACARVGGTG